PLLGTWVGTVIAFYFSRENFEAASRSLNQVVAKLTPEERLRTTPVRTAMRRMDQVKGIIIEQGKAEKDVLVTTIETLLVPPFTRAPIFTHDKIVKAVIHQSLLYKYLNDCRKAGNDPETMTLQDLLADPIVKDMAGKMAFCRLDASLAEAKEAMEKIVQCQD